MSWQYLVLQGMCDAGKEGPEYLKDFEFVPAFTCTFANTTGFLVLGLLFYAPIMMAIYITTDDVRVPTVLTLLTGGAVIPQIAGPAVTVATLLLLTVGAGVVTLLYYRYSR